MRTTPSFALLAAIFSGVIFSNQAAQAAGFYIQEQSVSGLGSAFSGSVTNLHDPSTVYFNPAGMTTLEGIQAQAGAHLLVPSAKMTNTGSNQAAALGGGALSGGNGGNPYEPSPVPNAFVTYQVNDNFWAGVGISAPFGLANEYDSDWFGRFDSVKTELLTIDIQPSIAYRVNDWLSLGAGVNIQHADAELTSAAAAGPGGGPFAAGTEGSSKLEGDDWSYGYTLGAQVRPLEGTVIGLSYRSAVSHQLEGRVSARGTTIADFDVAGSAKLALPDIATFGVAQDVGSKWTVHGQATWFGWNNFQEIRAVTDETFSVLGGALTRTAGSTVSNVVQNYQTTWAYALGADYQYSDDLTLRAGVQYDETPTTDLYRTSRTPDGDRTWLSGGATYQLNDKMALDLAATYIWISDEDIAVNRNNSFSTALQNNVSAETEGNVGIVAVGLTYKF